MSTLSSEESPRWAFFAHWQMPFVIAAIVLGLVGELPGFRYLSFVTFALLVLYTVGETATYRHTGILCPKCMDAVPTNASVLAVRRDWALRLSHWHWVHRVRIGVVIVAITLADIYFNPVVPLIVVAVWPWFALESWVDRFHRQVQPWCPYCRGHGHGHGVADPTPQPVGEKTG